MIQFILWSIIFYFLIRFTVNFLIPVFRATKKMKQQVKDFQEKVQGEQQPPNANFRSSSAKPGRRTKSGDYIDFEEVD